jgi:hypothetical protein
MTKGAHMRRLAVAASAILLLMGLAAGPASASAGTFVHGLAARNHCGDVMVTTRYAGYVRRVDFYDAQGALYETKYFARLTYQAVGNGVTLTSRNAANKTIYTGIDGHPHMSIDTGNMLHFTVPGAGNAIVDVGRLVFDQQETLSFRAGLSEEDAGIFCSAFV